MIETAGFSSSPAAMHSLLLPRSLSFAVFWPRGLKIAFSTRFPIPIPASGPFRKRSPKVLCVASRLNWPAAALSLPSFLPSFLYSLKLHFYATQLLDWFHEKRLTTQDATLSSVTVPSSASVVRPSLHIALHAANVNNQHCSLSKPQELKYLLHSFNSFHYLYVN